MSFELSEIVLGCGFEKGARRGLLEAIAHYADNETGLARVSLSKLALRAGMSERNALRWLPLLIDDPDMGGLVTRVRPAAGRGNAAVYRMDAARLEPVHQAIKVAGRRVFAGVSKALQDAGLAGVKASDANIRRVFGTLQQLLASEGEAAALRTVEALAAQFEAGLARRAEISVIGRPMPPEARAARAVENGPGKIAKPCQTVTLSDPGKGDSLVGKGDSLTSLHNKDTSPSGIIIPAGPESAGCGKLLAGAAVSEAEFIFDIEGLLAHATLSRAERRELIADLQGRTARVTRGLLAIRVSGRLEAERLRARWLDRLVSWAGDVGLSGVVFDAPFGPDG